jgi:hypothetical protein
MDEKATIPGITPMIPAIIQSMPAVVGFQVLSMSCLSKSAGWTSYQPKG